MDTKTYFIFNRQVQISAAQYEALSWIAFYSRAGNHEARLGAEAVATNVLKCDSKLVYEITVNDNCKGLHNLNKMSFYAIWDY